MGEWNLGFENYCGRTPIRASQTGGLCPCGLIPNLGTQGVGHFSPIWELA